LACDGPRLARLTAFPGKGSSVFTSIRAVQKIFRNHRTPSGEASVQNQFVGFGDVGGANGPSAKAPLANDMREI
jgi:hypothetical protein